jgi:RNA polymerase sigma-70 factor (ECF subfamily)
MTHDTQEFAAFYDEFLPQVYRYVRYRVSDTPTAEDLTATVFEKALRAWNARRKPEALAPWIFRIASNAVVSHYRQRGRRAQVPLEHAERELSSADRPEERVLQSERWARIQDGLNTLSRREQDIIALKFGNGLTNRAIAPIVGLSAGHVAVILHRAMRKLHARLEDDPLPLTTHERSISYG